MKPLNSLLIIGFAIVAAFSSLQLKAFTLYILIFYVWVGAARIVKNLKVKRQMALSFFVIACGVEKIVGFSLCDSKH
ncbi:hypothetical protein EC549_02890 [Helicobacter pylori]|nr:hypothetical protein EC549_02890 [Helicobacter pylori]